MHSALDAVVGGWELAGNYRYESGQYLRFERGMIAPTETPKTLGNVGAGNFWFDTTGFATSCRRSPAGPIRGSTTTSRDRTTRTWTSRCQARSAQGNLEAELPHRSV